MNTDIFTVIGGVVTGVGSISAVIAAIPVVKEWVLPKLSQQESDIIKLAISNKEYPYTILFVCGLCMKAYVQTPFKHDTTIHVSDEITTLLSKNLIKITYIQQGGPYMGDGQFIWLMLTQKGLRAANKCSKNTRIAP
ncbi:hypothetical protein [Aliivibrio fischeri]|uniref:hypothetical protein n=1 Tax=Aliivibrio fischeri TaxID=668 RepID=UPI00080DC44C|nr:hypothetical protein [Aliivibrio fischeri]OCH41419.1 hypothetical protein A6E02_15445 [Aliivibrio fischeri]